MHLHIKANYAGGTAYQYRLCWLKLGSTLSHFSTTGNHLTSTAHCKISRSKWLVSYCSTLDTAQATASNRMKFWVNGVQITN